MVSLLAASPGAVRAMGVTMVAGAPLSTYENDTGQHVAIIDSTTAAALGISPARLASHPAVFVGGIASAANQAQLAAAVTDADCTQSADLAGIYFAVQASYEQQLVNANQQALTAAVQQYRAAYARELAKLPALLRTARANTFRKPPRAARRPQRSS